MFDYITISMNEKKPPRLRLKFYGDSKKILEFHDLLQKPLSGISWIRYESISNNIREQAYVWNGAKILEQQGWELV